MVTQHFLHAIPIEILPESRLTFSRARLYEGVSIQKAVGSLARKVAHNGKYLSIQPGFLATHLIVIDESAYIAALDTKLALVGVQREKREQEFIDFDGICRHVLTAITLLGKCAWSVGGTHTFGLVSSDFPHPSGGYSHRPTQAVTATLRYRASADWFSDVRANDLRATCNALDCYYRDGSWWVDRLSVALGYVWSGLTAQHPELAFVAFCMALEAIASTSQNEITHILAERCAALSHPPGQARMNMYGQVKDLYALRSKIVHGRSAPKKGSISWESLAITAKKSWVPTSQVFLMLSVTTEVLNSVIARPRLLNILHVKRSEEKANVALNEYFLGLLLGGET